MKRLGLGKFVGMSALLGTLVVVAGCADESAATDTADEGQGVAQAPIEQRATEAERVGAAPEKRARKERRERGDEGGERGPRGDHGPMGKMGKGKGGHGPEKLLFTALKELDLTDAQRSAIESSLEDLKDARPEPPQGDASPFAKVAEQIRSGQVDAAALTAELEKHRPDVGAKREATTAALAKLHATLTPAQRKQLVDTVLARMDEHAEREADRDERGHHEGRGGPDGKRAGGPIGHMLRGLELSDAQQAKVDAALADLGPTEAERAAFEAKRETMKKEMRAKVESFASDRFDAAAAIPTKDPGMKADHHARMARALAAIVPVLDEAQRAELADRLEEGPKGFGRGKRGGPKGGR